MCKGIARADKPRAATRRVYNSGAAAISIAIHDGTMQEFLSNYGLFLAKTLTIVLALAALIIVIARTSGRRREPEPTLKIVNINDRYARYQTALEGAMLSKHQARAASKERRAAQCKRDSQADRKRIFVLDFDGDLSASAAASLAQEVTAVLMVARTTDEVVVRLHSPGGMVHGYGLAANQLQRIRDQAIPLTVAVDKVAASGGYMIACVADRILAAPFAIIGSIGVVAQLPNLHRFLQKHDIDFELLTAGKHKRTLTIFGENTEAAREKLHEQLIATHELFKSFVVKHRPGLNIEAVATGDYWHGTRALELCLIDELRTSDDYLLEASKEYDLFEVRYQRKARLGRRLMEFVQHALHQTGNS